MSLTQHLAGASPDDVARRERWADLMEAIAQRQDRDAFAELFQFFAPRVKSYMLRLGAQNGLAEELAQEVMVTIWRKAALFDRTQASVSTWIFRIARNRRIDAARRTAKPELDPEDASLQPEPLIAPDEAVSAAEQEALVRRALATLPPEQLELLQLAFYEGLSHSEIADRLGLPLGTVKSRIRLAFGKIRLKLQDNLDM